MEKLSPAEFEEIAAWLEEYQAMMGASRSLFGEYDREERRRTTQ